MSNEITDEQMYDIMDQDDVHALRELLATGLNINWLDEDRHSLLHLAASSSAKNCMQLLLEAGASVDKVDEFGKTPLADCIDTYDSDNALACMRLLVAAGADVNATDDDDISLVCDAASMGCERQLRFLLEAGADPNQRDWMGCNALHHAVMAHNAEAVRILLAAGADPTAQDGDQGYTPRDYARGQEARKCRELLTEALEARGIPIEIEPVMPVDKVRRRLHRRAVVFHPRLIKAKPRDNESCLGRVTWQLPGEGWPQDSSGAQLVPLATIFIKDLPLIPPALEKVALITIFAPLESWEESDDPRLGCVVRSYTTTAGLERCNYVASTFTPCLLAPELIKNDMPKFLDCGGGNEMWSMIKKIERIQGLDYEEDIMEADYETHKIGGYPSYTQDAPEIPADYTYVLQICSDATIDLNIDDCGNYYFYYNPIKNDWRVHADSY